MPKTYVARRYDVKFQSWLQSSEWDEMCVTWADLYEAYVDSDGWDCDSDLDAGWYEFKKADVRKLLEVLKTFRCLNGWLYAPGEASPICPIATRDYLEELLLISKHVPGFIRVEVR